VSYELADCYSYPSLVRLEAQSFTAQSGHYCSDFIHSWSLVLLSGFLVQFRGLALWRLGNGELGKMEVCS
jgi:hypothetical protein